MVDGLVWAARDAREHSSAHWDAKAMRASIARMDRARVELLSRKGNTADVRAMATRRLATMGDDA